MFALNGVFSQSGRYMLVFTGKGLKLQSIPSTAIEGFIWIIYKLLYNWRRNSVVETLTAPFAHLYNLINLIFTGAASWICDRGWMHPVPTTQPQKADPAAFQWWSTDFDVGPALNQQLSQLVVLGGVLTLSTCDKKLFEDKPQLCQISGPRN